MTQLLAAYPRGEQLTCAVSADGTRCFTADGATIAVLDTSTFVPEMYPSKVIDWIDVPDATPHQMLLFRGSLYVAGGTGGLFRLALSDGYFTNPVGALSHTLTALDSPFLTDGKAGDANTYRWKRCVDVAAVEQPGRRLVFGLFAASQRHIGVGDPAELGATELVAWRLNGNQPATYYGRFVFDSSVVVPVGTQNDIKGTSIAVDPGNSGHLYVSLGIRWVWRVDIGSLVGTNPDFRFPSAAELTLQATPALTPCGSAPCPEGERVRDLAIVRRAVSGGTQALAYAAMEYGRLVEFELPTSPSTLAPVLSVYSQGCNHGERVAAVVDAENNVVVAFGSQGSSATYADSAAPYRPTGIWRDACLTVGIPEPNPTTATPTLCADNGIRVLRRTPTAALSPLVFNSQPGAVGNSGILTKAFWGGLVLRSGGTERYRIYDATVSGGFRIHEIARIFTVDPQAQTFGLPEPPLQLLLRAHYQGPSTGHSDGGVAAGDDTFVYFGGEPFVASNPPTGYVMRIIPPTGSMGWQLAPIPQTNSVCPASPQGLATFSCTLQTTPAPFNDDKIGDPNPFLGGIMGGANWVDPWEGAGPDVPDHPVREWFVAAGPTWRQGTCLMVPGVGNCAFTNMCASLATASWRKSWLPSFDHLYPASPLELADQSRVGWKYLVLDPLVSNGVAMDLRWWQVVAPTGNPEPKGETTDLLYAENDPRVDVLGVNQAAVPRLVHGVRSASAYGYKVMSSRAYMKKAANVCPSVPADDVGRGQELDSVPVIPGIPTFYEGLTHVEFEPLPGFQPCIPFVTPDLCPSSATYRSAHNNRSHTFPLQTATQGTRYVTAIAAGFIASAPAPLTNPSAQGQHCQWTGDFGKLLVTFYDVTDTPGGPDGLNPLGAPRLLRVALGPFGGHAFSVRAKEYADGKTFVFVVDLIGEVHAIDISGDTLFLPAASTPYRPVGCTGSGCTPVLVTESAPGSRFQFPRDLIDGYRPNGVDIEVDGDFLYCALARGGVAVLDISRPSGAPLNIQPFVILDTPGLAQGVAFRGTGVSRQLIVGDSRAGLRLYGRSPQ